jgi:hypothetical protein
MPGIQPKTTIRSYVLAAISGVVIATVATAVVLYAVFAMGGYTREALVELSPWGFGLIAASGACVGLVGAFLFGQVSLPPWVRGAALGSLAGVATVVLATLVIAAAQGGPFSKARAPYLVDGLLYGVPTGLIVGGVCGLIVAKRHRAEQ